MQLPPQRDPRPLHDPNRVVHEQALAKARLEMLQPTKRPAPTYTAPTMIAVLVIMAIVAVIVMYYPR